MFLVMRHLLLAEALVLIAGQAGAEPLAGLP
jgi:hypothetical protein